MEPQTYLTLIPYLHRIRFPIYQIKPLVPHRPFKLDPLFSVEHPEFGTLITYEAVSRALEISAPSPMPPQKRIKFLELCERLRLIERDHSHLTEPEAIEL